MADLSTRRKNQDGPFENLSKEIKNPAKKAGHVVILKLMQLHPR
jgi:hypothetical protein